jgi:hypothetical protein
MSKWRLKDIMNLRSRIVAARAENVSRRGARCILCIDMQDEGDVSGDGSFPESSLGYHFAIP